MTDICRCPGGVCPIKTSCLRFTAVVHGRQDFFGALPFDLEIGECAYYIDEKLPDAVIREQAYAFWEQDGCVQGNEWYYWEKANAFLIAKKRG